MARDNELIARARAAAERLFDETGETSDIFEPTDEHTAEAAVRRFDELFAGLERGINGKPTEQRLAARQRLGAPVLADLKGWMQAERKKLSRHSPVAKAMDYMLRRWDRFARFLDDGRICLTNNAAERALRGIALGRKSWLFCGSDRGGVCGRRCDATRSAPPRRRDRRRLRVRRC